MDKIALRNGILAFILVLLLMPIGHAIMILNEVLLGDAKYYGAIAMGFLGVALIVIGLLKNGNPTFATLMGFLGGVLVWTGWVEFSFMWVAEKNNVANLMENGNIVTKREYLVMLSSMGLLCTTVLFYLFSRSNCTFFIWFQKVLGFRNQILTQTGYKKPFSIIVFTETIMLLWFFYILLLAIYDDHIAGDRHWITYTVAWGSLFWSLYLINRLVRIRSFDYAVRYAVPTVIIFWNFVEILGRWDLFKEIWIHPMEYWLEVLLLCLAFVTLMILFIVNPTFHRKGNKETAAT
ncbi:MAG: hypothetical protein KDC31_04130 [Saprospiraceae bacterium]|jgi:hypothetical protein|nr:MAG: hypothetical protein UZ08_BCD001001369 [Candidatus Parvibacillus calidus]MBX2937793.1 hypothetical protein [Saprospiraceae bacterium]MBK7740059.1 hypothetical protein [Candidatus Parvibacillus calidus]MBX7178191.1 hypothetical protein [Saprospiraceae bacterium]MCB0590456.1 hypothetical protein [Saprospiraceae bacterium]